MSNPPTFAPVFGAPWAGMPPALKLHYANRPFCRDRITVEGTLTVRMGAMMRILAPLFGALGMLTPRDGDDIPCTVYFLSEPDTNAFVFERWFDFPGQKRFCFRSRLVPKRGHEVVEYMRCGVGWRCTYHFEAGKVWLRHKGYLLSLFGLDIPLPWLGEILLGRGYAWEEASGERSFRMAMGMKGGLFGAAMAYGYAGEFIVVREEMDDA